ncbi:hypothetical protein CkaCkLH20_07647 [Colletotrichum karsti]|uniref:Uncharacterized protein n=1 Tax=Colletotrichum karsti TaxID=1095194 RepID=A0A9P6I1X5_9PEZI|nr:uncharacterized protein CkaCkLH20_07647 [Colletotrichum karsti]KAF9874953.1 hypothetical protein CkaCkLH20_07647 [Colletotrichum karsti]
MKPTAVLLTAASAFSLASAVPAVPSAAAAASPVSPFPDNKGCPDGISFSARKVDKGVGPGGGDGACCGTIVNSTTVVACPVGKDEGSGFASAEVDEAEVV